MTGFEDGPRKEKASPVCPGSKGGGEGPPGRLGAHLPRPRPRHASGPGAAAPASASHRKCGAARNDVGRASCRPAGPEERYSAPWCPEGVSQRSTEVQFAAKEKINWRPKQGTSALSRRLLGTLAKIFIFNLLIRFTISSAEKP